MQRRTLPRSPPLVLQSAEHMPDMVMLDLNFEDRPGRKSQLAIELAQREPPVAGRHPDREHRLLDRVAVAERGAVAFLQKSCRGSGDRGGRPDPQARAIGRGTRPGGRRRPAGARGPADTADSPHGYRVTTLSEPMKFWDVLEESPPDLLLLDVNMPEVTGDQAVPGGAHRPALGGVPILFLSAHDDSATIQRVFAAGADDYLAKPIVGSELLIRVANRLERTQLHRRLAETDVLTGLATRQKATQALASCCGCRTPREARLPGRHRPRPLQRDQRPIRPRRRRRASFAAPRTCCSEPSVATTSSGRWGGEEFVVGLYGMPLAAARNVSGARWRRCSPGVRGPRRRNVPGVVQRGRG